MHNDLDGNETQTRKSKTDKNIQRAAKSGICLGFYLKPFQDRGPENRERICTSKTRQVEFVADDSPIASIRGW